MSLVYKVFNTYKNYYVYDRNRHKIIVVCKEDYDALQGKDKDKKEKIFKKYQQHGFLKESNLVKITHPMNEYLEDYMGSHMEQLILQVTQKCNLRCNYCFYGENNYNTRTHSYLDMDFECAKKAIDYFFMRTSTVETVTIGFYGGEPLIKFDLIKQCISYIEETKEKRNVNYMITTNATLLTSDISAYLAKKNFGVIISLDGTKETHDLNRKFPNGKGSYDVIQKNLLAIKQEQPILYKKILFNTVISPQMDLKCVGEYYEVDEIMKEQNIMCSTLAEQYVESTITYDDKFFVESEYGDFKVFLNILERIDEENVSIIYRNRKNDVNKSIRLLQSNFMLPQESHHGGPCIPGAKRLFTNIKGEFFPCERVSELSSIMKLGTVDDGIELSKSRKLLNVGEVTANECLSCWAFNDCKICGALIDNLSSIDKNKNERECLKLRKNTLELFRDICMLKEMEREIR